MKKVIKNIFYVLGLVLLALVVGFLIYSCTSMNVKIDQEEFRLTMYKDKKEESFIYFGNFDDCIFYINEEYKYINNCEYKDNVFSLSNDDISLTFIAYSKDKLFNKENNKYFYFYGVNAQ